MNTTMLTGLGESTVGPGLEKAPTGICGLDQITGGGLPRGRVSLVAGAAGAGKTLLGLEFLVGGARKYGEPGVLLSFEESAEKVALNVRSLGLTSASSSRTACSRCSRSRSTRLTSPPPGRSTSNRSS